MTRVACVQDMWIYCQLLILAIMNYVDNFGHEVMTYDLIPDKNFQEFVGNCNSVVDSIGK